MFEGALDISGAQSEIPQPFRSGSDDFKHRAQDKRGSITVDVEIVIPYSSRLPTTLSAVRRTRAYLSDDINTTQASIRHNSCCANVRQFEGDR
jgi:hypothetical protein